MVSVSTTDLELAAALRPSLLRLVRLIRQQRADMSVSLGQLSAMGTLEKHGPMSAGELAANERVQPPTMSKVLASLEEAGYVRREAHPSDGRQAIIVLTDTGHALIESERRIRDAWFNQQIAKLDPDERERLASVVPVIDKLSEL
jgi:DNA-binding MarR family transcriptional regulator